MLCYYTALIYYNMYLWRKIKMKNIKLNFLDSKNYKEELTL